MAAGRGGGGSFFPFGESSAEIVASDVRYVDDVASSVHVAEEVSDASRDRIDGLIDA